MGQNMEFKVEHICEGDDFSAAANWHLGIATWHKFLCNKNESFSTSRVLNTAIKCEQEELSEISG